MQSVCVYCGSSFGSDERFAVAARQLGEKLAAEGRTLVYGGGCVGLMGVLADAVLSAGGTVIGVIPQTLVDREVAHHGVSELRIVTSMHERKALMADLSDGFIALPGGIGTLEELFEAWTWGQLGLHDKPYGLLNVAGFFDPLLAFLDSQVQARFVKQEHRDLLLVASDVDDLVVAMEQQRRPLLRKWIGPGDE